jgi:Na+(H+)/acetate symporter ActP
MTGYSRQVLMFSSDPNPQFVLSFVAVVILSFFLIGIGNRFMETVTDRATETHLAGGFVSGLYLGYNVDPDTMIIQELVGLSSIIGSSSLSFILTSLSILGAMEMILGFFYIWDKRGKSGALGTVLIFGSGYLLPRTRWIGIFVFLLGDIFYLYSEKSDF